MATDSTNINDGTSHVAQEIGLLPGEGNLGIDVDRKEDIVNNEDIELGPTQITKHNVLEFAHQGGSTQRERAARGFMEQNYLIPEAGDGKGLGPVGRSEKWAFMVFRESSLL